MEVPNPIKVNFKYTRKAFTATRWLSSLNTTFAADFETAVKYTPAELESFKKELEEEGVTKKRKIELNSKIKATPLNHPSHSVITHLSIAWSESDAYVFILDNEPIRNVVLNFLVNTELKQIWHNASYDFYHLYYHKSKFPKNYEDTQILAKTLINHVETFKARTGLKELAGNWYGAWGIDSTMFDLSSINDPKMLLYAATDACATFKLWEFMQSFIDKENKEYYGKTNSTTNSI